MSFTNPAFHIDRQTVEGVEPEFVKMWDPRPVGASPVTPERVNPSNPVPEVMQALGLGTVSTPRTRSFDLLNGLDIDTWDGLKRLHFMTVRDTEFGGTLGGGTYPGPICRVPRGVVFHGVMSGKGPPPHTIHWHGIEPTPINDGVGHCSMEFGTYLYQWQPNFIGTYFFHCHRNTVQHFEFGLFGFLPVETPDAYFASIVGSNWRAQTIPDVVQLNGIPVGAGIDGRFRTAANLSAEFQAKFPGFVGGDPVFGCGGPNDSWTMANMDPHAFTVPYDVEAIWIPDDRDSVWSDDASNAFQTFPIHGDIPGVNDNFFANVSGGAKFFNFNDFRPDYFFISGVAVPTPVGGTGSIPPGVTLPPALNSGKSGGQVSVNAQVGQTIFIRCLDAAYNNIRVTLPVDAVIIEWDGRALGVPPYGYSEAYLLPKNTPITISVARRFGALVRETSPISSNAKVEFMDTRGGNITATALIPFNIV